MKIGLFFGSFNPIHIGHLAIANYMVEFTDLDQIWIVVSPHNPLKDKTQLISPTDRLEMVREAVSDDVRFRVSDIEFQMPQPSYTIDTIHALEKEFPGNTFVIVMGSDGLETFDQWKDYEILISTYQRYVYPRPETPEKFLSRAKNIVLVHAPFMDISATFIRTAIAEGKDVRHFVAEKVWGYIKRKGLYF